MRYAIVMSRGRYGSGEKVYASRVCGDLTTARRLAVRWTRHHQAEMARYGGTSGGFRVVETEAQTRREAVWVGHDLNDTPDV